MLSFLGQEGPGRASSLLHKQSCSRCRMALLTRLQKTPPDVIWVNAAEDLLTLLTGSAWSGYPCLHSGLCMLKSHTFPAAFCPEMGSRYMKVACGRGMRVPGTWGCSARQPTPGASWGTSRAQPPPQTPQYLHDKARTACKLLSDESWGKLQGA